MQTKITYAFTIVIVCLCASQPGCWAKPKHGKIQDGLALNKGVIGDRTRVEGDDSVGLDFCRSTWKFHDCIMLVNAWGFCLEPNEEAKCVKNCGCDCTATEEGYCCHFPFLFMGKERHECISGLFTNKKWCGTTNNFDKDKKWGWCKECSVKTEDGKCCVFPFLYKGIERQNCTKGVNTDRKWCGTTYNYDQDKKWGWCPSEDECSVKTEDGKCCVFPFLYKGIKHNSCTKGVTTDRKWCGTTYNYDQDKKWGWCQ